MKWAYKKALFVLTLTLFLGVLSLSSGYILGQEATNPLDKPADVETATQPSGILPSVGEAAGSELISVNFINADILEVIGVFSEKTGLNMVVGPDVKATVTIELNSLPWEKALDIILKNYNLIYKKEDKLIRVMTLEQLKQEEEKVPLITRVITFNFARAEDVKSSFSSMLSLRGRVDVNTRTNSLIITDLPDNVDKIEVIANSLDSRTPQVMIEALMADVKLTNEEQLGINWKFARNADWTTGKSAQAIIDQNITLPTSSAATITFGQTILKAVDLTATIKAWQQEKRVNILAHPLIMTLDNQSAHIELVEQIPYTQQSTSTESSSAISTTSFKEAGIKLDVTPHITTKDNYISMNLKVEQSFRSGYTPDNQPIIDSRKAETNLLVKNNETVVIGGLRKKEDSLTIEKIPFLGDIPLLGVFFRKRVSAVDDVDLLIFVTPQIVTEPKLTAREKDRLERFSPTPEDESKLDRYYKKPKPKTKPQPVKSLGSVKEEPVKKEEDFYLRPPS